MMLTMGVPVGCGNRSEARIAVSTLYSVLMGLLCLRIPGGIALSKDRRSRSLSFWYVCARVWGGKLSSKSKEGVPVLSGFC
jgi:hypothetical protein